LSLFEADITDPELDFSLFTSRDWTLENNQALNKSLEMAFREEERLKSDSPDSGIGLGNFEFDIEGCSALLSGNDPNLNGGEFLPSSPQKSITGDSSSINTTELLVPVVTYNSQEEVDTITYMDSSDEENENIKKEEDDSDITENVSINPSTIHSYSILKPNNKRTMKSKRPANFNRTKKAVRTLISKGQQISVPVMRKGKRKLYELEPLCDPVAEKNRQNALNAKKNRDKKKAELQEAAVEIDRLREENDDLRSESDNYRDQLEAARRELDMLKQLYKASAGALPPCLGNKAAL